MPTTDATLRTSRAGASRPSSRAPITALSVSGRRGAPGSTSTIRPSRNSSVPSSIEARTVSPMNSGLPWVRSWIRRASPASRAARATIVASCAVSAGARPPRSTRSTCPSDAQSGMMPGRVVARMTSGRTAAVIDQEFDHPAAGCIQPVEVVEDDDPRTVRVEHPLDVCGRDLAQDRGDLGRVVGDVDLLRLPARERRVPGDRRDRTAVAPHRRLVGARREQQLAGVAPGVDLVLVGDGLREEPREAVRLAATIRDALGPGPGVAEPTRLVLEVGDEARLAHPRVAGRSGRPPRAPTGGPVSACVGPGPSRAPDPRTGSPASPDGRRGRSTRIARSARRAGRPMTAHAARPNRGRPRSGGRGRRARSPRRAGSHPAGRGPGSGPRS